MKNFKHFGKRGLALFVALVMCLGLVQVIAFAEEELQEDVGASACETCGQDPCVCTPDACETCGQDPCVCTPDVCETCGQDPYVCTPDVCETCGQDPCVCTPDVCETCGQDPCVCTLDVCETCGQDPCVCTPDACETCGQDPCVCTPDVCETCGQDPCVCTPDVCETCGQDPCVCEGAEDAAVILDKMIAALPAPDSIDVANEAHVQAIHAQIAEIEAFVTENALILTEQQQAILDDVKLAAWPVETTDDEEPSMVLTGYCGADNSSCYNSETYGYNYSRNNGSTVEGTYTCYSNAVWTLTETGTTVIDEQIKPLYKLTISGTGEMVDFNSPDWGRGLPWFDANNAEISREQINEIVVEEGITKIGAYAFRATGKTVTLADSIESIGAQAFNWCGLQKIQLPAALTEIGSGAFQYSGLTTIEGGLPNGLKTIGDAAFFSSQLTGDLIIPNSVEKIGNSAFCRTKLSGTLTLGDSLIAIGDSAFAENKFTGDLIIPDSVERIGAGAFRATTFTGSLQLGCGLQTIGASNTFTGCKFSGGLIILGGLESIPYMSGSEFKYVRAGSAKIFGQRVLMNCRNVAALDMTEVPDDATFSPVPYDAFGGLGSASGLTIYLRDAEQKAQLCDPNNKTGIPALVNRNPNGAVIAITNGGIFPYDAAFEGGSKTLETPIKHGFTFDGWYTEDGTNGEWGEKVSELKPKSTYYAKWTKSSASVTPAEVRFETLTYGGTPVSQELSLGENVTATAAFSSNDAFAVSVTDGVVTVTPATNLRAGQYHATILVTLEDSSTTEVAVSLTVSQEASVTTPVEEKEHVDATYGDIIVLSAQVGQESVRRMARRAAAPAAETGSKKDYVAFYCGDTLLDTAAVVYDSAEDFTKGTATLYYDTMRKGIPTGEGNVITAVYGGSVNLNGSDTDNITVTLSPKPLTVKPLTLQATDRPADGSAAVQITGTPTLEGVIANDTVKPVVSPFGTMADTACGENKQVNVKIDLADAHAEWYTVTAPELTVNILHNYKTSVIAPTCTEDGYTRHQCIACEHFYDETPVSALGHSYKDTVTAPTCTAGGYTTHTCERCTDSYRDTETEALEHTWDDGVVTTPPTYDTTGVRTYTCTVCGATRTEILDRLVYVPSYPSYPSYPSGGGSSGGGSSSRPSATIPDDPAPLDPGTDITDQDAPLASLPLPFVDVRAGEWYRDAVAFVFSKGLMKGLGDTEFAPELSTQRGMIVTILHRLEGAPAAAAAGFADVAANQWYTDAVNWGEANGVITGYSAVEFAPLQNITREQLAAILYRYAQLKGYDSGKRADLSVYIDAEQISEYAVEAMRWAVAEGLMTGKTANTLVPGGEATRAETAMILMRFCQSIAK